jgi:hypothetical protein
MIVRVWLWLLDLLKVNFALHKKIIFWFWFFIAAGLIIALIAIPRQEIIVDDINSNLIDRNIINATGVGSSFGSFIWGRLIALFLPLLLLFLFCVLSNFTALIVFPFMALQGYWLVMSCWWIMQEYAFSSMLLLLFYGVWSVLVLQVLIAAVIWIMKLSAAIRQLGWRCGFSRRELLVGIGTIVGVQTALASVEYLVYWVFLARIIY